MALVWIVIALLLIGVELHHLAFFAVFGSAGAVAAAVVAAFAPSAIPVQIVVGVAVAGAGVVLVRPHMSHAFARRGPGVVIGGVHGGLVGARGVTIDHVGVDPNGHVKLLGEKWLAVSLDAEQIPPATSVIVTKVVGTTLTVRAAAEHWELS